MYICRFVYYFCKRYSGSDIFVIADDALMGPLRKVRMTSKAPQDSTEFREAVECVSITIVR
jgi:SpoVK/Ycf46/Vps4 family AAA+-type ATPase